MKRPDSLKVSLVILVVAASSASAQTVNAQPEDVLGKALSSVGFTRADLGYRPKGYWTRYPNPQRIPHKLPFFDDLFAEPLEIYGFVQSMGAAVQQYLNPEYLAKNDNATFKLVYYLGVDKKVVGFRGYNLNLTPEVDEQTPLFTAIAQIFQRTNYGIQKVSFGEISPWLDEKKSAMEQAKSIDLKVQKILAGLILNLLDAQRWQELAFRNVPVAAKERAFGIRDLGTANIDALKYYPEIDDVAATIDEQSLYYAGMKAAQATEMAKCALLKLLAEDKTLDVKNIHFNLPTPMGRIVFAGTGNDVHDYDDCAILVDFGGDDRYVGGIAANTSLSLPIAVALDLSGNDKYENERPGLPSQGAGLFGVGVLLDVAGDDEYTSKSYSQGLGYFGLGLLLEEKGNDKYILEHSGQGAGHFGIGLCLDAEGKDEYVIKGDGQGYGGCGGVGVLANGSGDDRYFADPWATNGFRPDYHSQHKVNHNNVQGAGSGRRGDGADGHC